MSNESEKLYYIQVAGYCGNSMVFWRKGSRGYTPNLDEAGTFTLEEARKATSKPTSWFWPKEYIDSRATFQVDCQRVDHGMCIGADRVRGSSR